MTAKSREFLKACCKIIRQVQRCRHQPSNARVYDNKWHRTRGEPNASDGGRDGCGGACFQPCRQVSFAVLFKNNTKRAVVFDDQGQAYESHELAHY